MVTMVHFLVGGCFDGLAIIHIGFQELCGPINLHHLSAIILAQQNPEDPSSKNLKADQLSSRPVHFHPCESTFIIDRKCWALSFLGRKHLLFIPQSPQRLEEAHQHQSLGKDGDHQLGQIRRPRTSSLLPGPNLR